MYIHVAKAFVNLFKNLKTNLKDLGQRFNIHFIQWQDEIFRQNKTAPAEKHNYVWASAQGLPNTIDLSKFVLHSITRLRPVTDWPPDFDPCTL
jgi:hypothetical protein